MRQLKYLGSKTSIGRFGIVNYGDIIEATEDEYACVKGDKRFKLVGGSVNGESKALAAGLLPFGTNYFDLRTIPWEAENVSARLNARFSRYQLKCVIEAMKFIGAVVPEVDLEGDKIFIVDAIVTAAYNMRWDSLSEQLRHKLEPFLSPQSLSPIWKFGFLCSRPTSAIGRLNRFQSSVQKATRIQNRHRNRREARTRKQKPP